MVTVQDLSLSFGDITLFKDVNLKFTANNCYGIIGANGAGKSTFLKIISGQIESSSGDVFVEKDLRMSMLKQDHYAFNDFIVLDAIIFGNKRLYDVMRQKEDLYNKKDFNDKDGILASELETEFAELKGWEAESESAKLLKGLGLSESLLKVKMSGLSGPEKVKVLIAQALFGDPDILLMDEPTNNLDVPAINWLEEFLINYPGTVIVVSHDRHFLNQVCTHIVDIDYTKIKMYVGNYEFWYESSLLMQRTLGHQNKKTEERIKELKSFIERFSANKSKAKQATSRKKLLEKLTVDEMPASSRKYPFIAFDIKKEVGKDILTVKSLTKIVDGEKLLDKLNFTLSKGEKIAFVSENEFSITNLFEILTGKLEPDEGSFKWGVSTSRSYFPKDNTEYFKNHSVSIIDWMRLYSKNVEESRLRGFLGRMLFSNDDVFKSIGVLSGGEKVRCMFSRMMLYGSNVLLFDQPTNHLDLESITALNKGLVNFKGNILFSSHDREFVETVSTRTIKI
ncbi:MAG: ATP-binding cassette domain-containing protein [Oscillospiraceae bacterium]|jgi:ATPase subunit of ABC transporter with duplicated ATPase domains|nr:ATP-binding cassette domain-containing protein [Oscillospiraceae bacterium]